MIINDELLLVSFRGINDTLITAADWFRDVNDGLTDIQRLTAKLLGYEWTYEWDGTQFIEKP